MEDIEARLKALDVLAGDGDAKKAALAYFSDKGMSESDVLDSYWADNKGVLDSYLYAHGTTRYQVAQASDVSETQLNRAVDKPDVSEIKMNIIFAVAEVVGATPGSVLDDLIAIQSGVDDFDKKLEQFERESKEEDEKYLSEHDDEVEASLAKSVAELKKSNPEAYKRYLKMVERNAK
ncbi:hypothetical protein [Levilactobacillus humaensis]|uniref:hypothetical protein n=1 Tax=Levilactobacillus humaensis TaxID=2950375 RepID=UPI0021C4C230|nr:hypothetical protein [Levilactobacillus humaensis]